MGAIGAFGVLLAFGAKGTPAVVMSIVFAGAPVVSTGGLGSTGVNTATGAAGVGGGGSTVSSGRMLPTALALVAASV